MTIQERLRAPNGPLGNQAADHIDALEAKLETATEAAATYRKAMLELTAMLVESAAKVDALAKVIKPSLAAMNSINVNCENFHHRKKDQHEPGAECKPRLRYLVAFSALEKAIAEGKV